MSEFEGWKCEGAYSPRGGAGSVSYRNHNPGNLRYSIFQLGVRDGFAYFYNDATGMFAMQYDIMRKCQGKTVTNLTGNSTVKELIKVYSTAMGKELDCYVRLICERTGIDENDKIKELIKN